MYHATILYNKNTNKVNQDNVSCMIGQKKSQQNSFNNWAPPSADWLKLRTDASRITDRQSTTIRIACRDHTGRIHYRNRKEIGDCLILTAETLVIREVLMTAIQENHSNVIIEAIIRLLSKLLWGL